MRAAIAPYLSLTGKLASASFRKVAMHAELRQLDLKLQKARPVLVELEHHAICLVSGERLVFIHRSGPHGALPVNRAQAAGGLECGRGCAQCHHQ